MSQIESVRAEAERRFGHRAKVSVFAGGIGVEVVDRGGQVWRHVVHGPYFEAMATWLDEWALVHG